MGGVNIHTQVIFCRISQSDVAKYVCTHAHFYIIII